MVDASLRLLDFSQPLDVPLLDHTVGLFLHSPPEQIAAIAKLLQSFQEHPDAWTRVDAILEQSTNPETKYLALRVCIACKFCPCHCAPSTANSHKPQILEGVIKFRWGALPLEQREGIKNYISNLIIKLSVDEAMFRTQKGLLLPKLNQVLVQMLKHDWPGRWASFIPDLVAASKTSETLCENSMHILRLLSEEVFDFSRGELTQVKIRELKAQLNNEFRLIHDLCLFVLMNTQKPELVKATLAALEVYLSWVPLAYIFESNLIQILLQLFPQPPYRNVALRCLSEVGGLQMGPEFHGHFETFFKIFLTQLQSFFPLGPQILDSYNRGNDEYQQFIQNLALFFTGFFRSHVGMMESSRENQAALVLGMEYLIAISYVENVEVFKTCLDYWNFLVPDIYSSVCTLEPNGQFAFGGQSPNLSRKTLYGGILSKLRQLMINRMAKPEEVIVVVDEHGNAIREQMKDNDVLTQYRTMRETLIYLSHLDYEDTEQQMLEKLRQQAPGKWTPTALNTLCWAIGSISGSMQEEQENRFLVTVIRDLLTLVEVTRGKDNKAIIASNIMYVVGQYPKFLRQHWKFLKTVVMKLFEFMHERHPGVQDMACDTFLKICHKCKRKFVVKQVNEDEPFIVELLTQLGDTIHELELHQVVLFYEAVGLMISAETDFTKRDEYLARLMAPPNTTWQTIIMQAGINPDMLRTDRNAMKSIQNVLQSNVAVCTSLGPSFVTQMNFIFSDMLQLYKLYSEFIGKAILEGGPHASKTHDVNAMRSVKKTALRLIEAFSEKCDDPNIIAAQYVPAMMDPVLGDYARATPDAREAEVLGLFATIISKQHPPQLRSMLEPLVPRILEATFEPTLTMITRDFENYPDHRLKFFQLLHAIVNNCFHCLFMMSGTQLKYVVDAIVWAIRHTERNVAETGLNVLLDMLVTFHTSEFATQFHQTYYLKLMQEIFAVMTDTMHKPGFKMHARILHHLFGILKTDVIKAPLWDVAVQGPTAYPSNADFIQESVVKLLSVSFPNMMPAQVQACVLGMFKFTEFSDFKHHLRDFLVQSKSFASQDNADLFAEDVVLEKKLERQRIELVPGMVPPMQRADDMADA